MYKIDLNTDWLVKCEDLYCGSEMLSVVLNRDDDRMEADLTCDVHMPLMQNGKIKEPLEADIFLNGFNLGHHKSAFYAFTRMFMAGICIPKDIKNLL